MAVASLAVAVVACAPTPPPPGPPPRPVYPYAPSPVSGPANPNTCRKVLVMGDSLAFEASDELQAKYQQYGYCVTLVKGATFGGNTMVDADGNPQTPRLANFLAGAPDGVVFSFVGNVEPPQVSAAETAYLGLVDRRPRRTSRCSSRARQCRSGRAIRMGPGPRVTSNSGRG